MKDIYCYPKTDILINKFDIHDREKLDEAERNITFAKLLQADKISQIFENGFNQESLMKLHEFVFGEIYDWAGKPREIDIEKAEKALNGFSVEYAKHETIPERIDECIETMKQIQWSKMNLDDRAAYFSECMASLWQVHPFREGNTRTVVNFCCEFAEAHGFPMDKSLLQRNAGYVRTALVAASFGEFSKPEYLERIVKDSMCRGEQQVHEKNGGERT
ncbi:MAG: Fic family protein [Oscillospiraceae bacterium]|nr:Fic family protein [Oscillospiraceae bacterium]